MNGPQHYREAERLLSNAQRSLETATPNTVTEAQSVAESAFMAAQVHATLALAAATAEPWAFDTDDHSGAYVHDRWVEALS